MFFGRVFAFASILASFALSSHARMHHVRAIEVTAGTNKGSADAVTFVASLNTFQKDIVACSDNISKTASTGKDPEEELKRLNTLYTAISFPTAKLTADQEKECAVIVTAALTKSIKACHDVAAKHNYMKYYSEWTETDFAMHSFMQKLAGLSFSVYKQSLVNAGKTTAVYLHDMKMRHMVNDFRGMGISYE
ncbi:hypothetical protein OPQ81_000326 [Rhizoctonia solani]|nr:hypothetical protein OPQ81_000326 [Rhizoctonia solani]